MYITQRFESIVLNVQLTVSAVVPQTVASLLAALPEGIVVPNAIQGFAITNNHASATVYMDFQTRTDSLPTSSTTYWRSLAAGETYELLVGRGTLNELTVLSSVANSKINFVVFQ